MPHLTDAHTITPPPPGRWFGLTAGSKPLLMVDLDKFAVVLPPKTQTHNGKVHYVIEAMLASTGEYVAIYATTSEDLAQEVMAGFYTTALGEAP